MIEFGKIILGIVTLILIILSAYVVICAVIEYFKSRFKPEQVIKNDRRRNKRN
jgi:hypothetical protein